MTPAEHYADLGDLYREIGQIEDTHTPGNADFRGWYRTRDGPAGWDGEGRAWALGKEWAGLRRQIDRVVYATVNYAPARWFMQTWHPFNYGDNGKEWQDGETPTPGYGDLMAYAPFADIDLADTVKTGRPTGDVPRDTIEAALSRYLDAFAALAGDRDHVFALDSVGGAYVMVAPTSTAPIADAFDRPDRAVLFDDLTDRLNEWLEEVRADVNEAVPDAAGTFEPDALNHKNRLYKAPLSLHKKIDGVVTPLDTRDPEYSFTAFEDAADYRARAVEWAGEFTGDHRAAIDSIVSTLWPDYYADAGEWESALTARVRDLEASHEQDRERRRAAIDPEELPDDMDSTDDLDTLNAAIEGVDVRDVARAVADAYDTDPGRDPVRFDPPWRGSSSGTSCFVDANKFYDLEGGKGGGALRLVAFATPGIDPSLEGNNYWKAVNELRKLGFRIPYFEGRKGTHPDVLGLFEDPGNADDRRRQVVRAVLAGER